MALAVILPLSPGRDSFVTPEAWLNETDISSRIPSCSIGEYGLIYERWRIFDAVQTKQEVVSASLPSWGCYLSNEWKVLGTRRYRATVLLWPQSTDDMLLQGEDS